MKNKRNVVVMEVKIVVVVERASLTSSSLNMHDLRSKNQ